MTSFLLFSGMLLFDVLNVETFFLLLSFLFEIFDDKYIEHIFFKIILDKHSQHKNNFIITKNYHIYYMCLKFLMRSS